MTGLQASSSNLLVDSPDGQVLLGLGETEALSGDCPRLIDEWQLAPQLWNAARREIDTTQEKGQFIFAGSARPAYDIARHTGAGRFGRIRMHTMTPWERGVVPGGISLEQLFEGEEIKPITKRTTYTKIVDLICHGGLPADFNLPTADSLANLREYVEETSHVRDNDLIEAAHRPETIRRALRALARNTATAAKNTTLAADVDNEEPGMDRNVLSNVITTLENMFVVDRQHPWSPSLRSKARLRRSDVLHLSDAGFAVAALNANSTTLQADPKTAGFLFETLVYHTLRVNMDANRGRVEHYHDSYGLEADEILLLPDGKWAAIEVELGSGQTDAALANLHKLLQTVDTQTVGQPAFCAVITGTDLGYTLPASHKYATPGVATHVIPFTALQP